MIPPLLISIAAFLFLSGVLIRERFNLANASDCVDRIAVALEDVGL
jgi:hypothetical protein